MNKIQVQVKQVYGKQTIYPVCDKAKAIARLLGTKTLTSEAIQVAKLLGHEIEQVFEQVRL